MDTLVERILFFSRWLLMPLYLGLAGALVFLIYKLAAEFVHVALGIAGFSERKVILSVLSLIDITLVANLLLMVILSGYENFVSRIDVAVGRKRPNWLGNLDFSALKLKLIGSIVAVAAIDLLGAFMNVDQFTSEQLAWKIGIQMSFVVAGVLYALMERIAVQARHIEEDDSAPRQGRMPPAHERRIGPDH